MMKARRSDAIKVKETPVENDVQAGRVCVAYYLYTVPSFLFFSTGIRRFFRVFFPIRVFFPERRRIVFRRRFMVPADYGRFRRKSKFFQHIRAYIRIPDGFRYEAE